MHIATIVDLQMSTYTMHLYVASPNAAKTMMHMLSNDLGICAKSVYRDAMEERVHFHKDVTIEYADTITYYQACHEFAPSIIERMSKS